MIGKHRMDKPHQAKQNYLVFTVFFAGMVTMAVEFAASRLLENVFGTSNIVWASIIGLILIYLTLGYWLGGKLADRYPYEKTIYTVLIWAGFLIGIIPLIARPVLRISSNAFDQLQMPILFGSFSAVLILFLVPVTLLGTASPIALKLALKDTQQTGRIAGKMSAISTMGSFLGTFLTVLVFIPLVGTYRTFIIFSELLCLICLIGLWRAGRWRSLLPYLWMPIAVAVLGIVSLKGSDKTTSGLIYETESAYNYIQVLEVDGYRYLRLNEGQGMHSIYHPTELFYGGPWSQVLVAPYFIDTNNKVAEVNRIGIVGLAAGTTARQAANVYPDAVVDGYEIDPKIVEVGRTYFMMNMPYLNVFVEDGRWGIAHSKYLYDIISVDAYKVPYIPAHMTTVEFFSIIKEHLTSSGMMVINVGRSPFNRELVDDLGATILEVFPEVFVTDIPDSFNTIIFASNSVNASWNAFLYNRAVLMDGSAPSLLTEAMAVTVAGRAEQPAAGRVYTDDQAPIEWKTNQIVLDYIFSGETELLP
jgi:spermidine synthase